MQNYKTTRSLSHHISSILENAGMEVKSTSELISADAVLPSDITLPAIPATLPMQWKRILLTGTTGHLGVHCLDQLLESGRNLIVYCLICGSSEDEAKEKLQKAYARAKLTLPESSNLQIVLGDISKDKLDLSSETYSNLSGEIDAILHCAALVDHLSKYSDGTDSDMRTHNVKGMLNMLKFASDHKTKYLLYTSTMGCGSVDSSGHSIEEYPDKNETFDSEIQLGYLMTKIVGEKLAAEATERGLPITTLRLPFILGNSETGHMGSGYNHLWSMILASIQIRLIPRGPFNGIAIVAVDSAAKVTIDFFLSGKAEFGVYNLTASSSVSEQVISDVLERDYGINCEVVPLKEWRDVIFEENGPAWNLVSPVKSFYEEEQFNRSIQFLARGQENIQTSGFSPKMSKNFPELCHYLEPAELILERHLWAHFNVREGN